MASMKDLMMTNEVPSKKSINSRDMWMLNVPGYLEKIPVRMILGITAWGKSTEHPKENCLYIIQIWCAQDKYKFDEIPTKNILQSVKIDM